MRQGCHACGNRDRSQFNFLQEGNRIEIVDEKDAKFTGTSYFGKSRNPHQLILDYFKDLFMLQRQTRTVWVYDKVHCVWRTDAQGNTVVGQLVDELNEKHILYLKAYKQIVLQKQLDAYNRAHPDGEQEAGEVFVLKIHKAARKFMKDNTPLITLAPAARGKILEELRNFTIHNEVVEMNRFPHLVPMKNKKYVNAFTGEVGDMEAPHYFTSCVDAEMISDNDEVRTIKDWFREISTGDDAKCEYLKRIAGYCFTFLVHDRKLYALWGNGHNGKGMYKEFIMEINNGPEGFDSRAKNLLQNFWTFRGNANQSPENATPESFQLLNKVLLYTDDMMPVPLDTNKVKRTVGGEKQSGRNLYGSPVDILPKGKVMWTLNFPPNAPGDDNAYWERSVLVKFLTKYVEEGPVDPLNFRFRKNHARYLELLEMKDAFFTVCMQRLIAYYQSLPWNHARKEPAMLTSFPLPASVKATNEEERANKLPLAKFMKDHTAKAINILQYVKVADLFKNYLNYLENINEAKLKRETTETTFIQLLATALDIHCAHGALDGFKLTREVVLVRKDNHAPYGPPLQQQQPEGSYLDRAMPPRDYNPSAYADIA